MNENTDYVSKWITNGNPAKNGRKSQQRVEMLLFLSVLDY